MVEQSGTALLLEQICNHHEDKIMPLGAFKAALMGTAGVSAGASVVLLHDTDYSDAASADITSGIDSTYGEYIFKFYNINPATDNVAFRFQVNAAGGSGYDETITSTAFFAYHAEDDGDYAFTYQPSWDLAQGTDPQAMTVYLGNDADGSSAGELHLFNPSSTTYVKHFYSRVSSYWYTSKAVDHYAAGYINTTTAIDDIQFTMSSGNFDGTIKMWGVK